MLLWSMVRAIVSDPGRVPIYWGFFLDEKETKKRRYCLLCHSFKPERYRKMLIQGAITVRHASAVF